MTPPRTSRSTGDQPSADINKFDRSDAMSVLPVCFMVMPFGKDKSVPASAVIDGRTAPPKINFDRLWELAYEPAIKAAGYQAVRADQDWGASIVNDMLERLAFADLIVADLTLANANVYYEVGVRHGVRKDGCVLIAADWAKQLFDLDQTRRGTFAVADTDATDAEIEAIKKMLTARILNMAAAPSPIHALPGFGDGAPDKNGVFRKWLEQVSLLSGRIEAARVLPAEHTRDILADVAKTGAPPEVIVAELLRLVRDKLGFADVATFIAALPAALQNRPYILEQKALAQGKTGDIAGAVATLNSLISLYGGTSERFGLLGGRYKQLKAKAATEQEKRRYLNLAIDAYEKGMACDLNDYYPSCNLPRLLRERGEPGDAERAQAAGAVALAACERALARRGDEWVRPTLLGAAFDAQDADKAEKLLSEVRREGHAAWKIDTTLTDLELSLKQAAGTPAEAQLAAVLAALEKLASPA
jgi:hypothetical protein